MWQKPILEESSWFGNLNSTSLDTLVKNCSEATVFLKLSWLMNSLAGYFASGIEKKNSEPLNESDLLW